MVKTLSVLVILVLLVNSKCLAQGFWNISYTSIDRIDSSLLGKEVRIDFKSTVGDKEDGQTAVNQIRKLLLTTDTITLDIDGRYLCFQESWKFYVDHGILGDQELVSFDDSNPIKIEEMFLLSINDTSIIVRAFILELTQEKRDARIVIDRQRIKGVLSTID